MKRLKYLLLAAICGSMVSLLAEARTKRVPAYIFGYGVSMLDSTAYITDIQRLDTVILEDKTGFLRDRHLYSMQLNGFLEDSLQLKNMTCTVLYHKKRNKLEKTMARLRKVQARQSLKIKTVGQGDFAFHPELWPTPEDEIENMSKEERKALKKAQKAQKKEAKKKEGKPDKKSSSMQKRPAPGTLPTMNARP